MRKHFVTALTALAAVVVFASCAGGNKSSLQDIFGDSTGKPDDAVAVDLGLPSGTKWASMNVGATTPYEAGSYFQWGETTPCDELEDILVPANYTPGGTAFTGNSVDDFGSEKDPMSAEGILQKDRFGYNYGNIAGDARYDAATANWGEEWSTPTLLQMRELLYCCSWTPRTLEDGHLVYKVVGPSGDSIFVAAAGYRGTEAESLDSPTAVYWTSTLGPDEAQQAHTMMYQPDGLYFTIRAIRLFGCNVRPVIAGRDKMREASPTAVDLALPSGTLWADMNVGACSPEEYGDYFQWGEITPCTYLREHLNKPINYTPAFLPLQRDNFGTGKDPIYAECQTENNCNLTGRTKYDAATANWGQQWCMPSRAQMDELVNECEWNMCSRNGVAGALVTGRNGNSIFLPAAGQRSEDDLYFERTYGHYWSGESFSKYDTNSLYFLIDRGPGSGVNSRRLGFSVRPVSATATSARGEETDIDGTTLTSDIIPIDLGLPSGTLWANMNVGATSPDDPGGYYAWGETETKDSYDAKNYAHFTGSTIKEIGNNIAKTQYDVAHVKWGKNWHMPTKEQFEELMKYCTWTLEERDKSYGFLIKANNQAGKSIFLPAAGNRAGSDLPSGDMEIQSAYWTATASPNQGTWHFTSSDDVRRMDENGYRPYGLCIRAVIDSEP